MDQRVLAFQVRDEVLRAIQETLPCRALLLVHPTGRSAPDTPLSGRRSVATCRRPTVIVWRLEAHRRGVSVVPVPGVLPTAPSVVVYIVPAVTADVDAANAAADAHGHHGAVAGLDHLVASEALHARARVLRRLV